MRITRRTSFALPLVLVVGCGSSPKSTAPPTTEDTEPTKTEKEKEELPPPPGSGEVTKSTEGDVTVLTYASGDRVYVHKDGTCHAEYSGNCGRGNTPDMEPATCNPPPPQQVQCPADAK